MCESFYNYLQCSSVVHQLTLTILWSYIVSQTRLFNFVSSVQVLEMRLLLVKTWSSVCIYILWKLTNSRFQVLPAILFYNKKNKRPVTRHWLLNTVSTNVTSCFKICPYKRKLQPGYKHLYSMSLYAAYVVNKHCDLELRGRNMGCE